jgi:hypothetical protein
MLHNKKKKPSSHNINKTELHLVLNNLLEINKISLVQLHHNTGVALTTLKRMRKPGAVNPTIQSLLPIAQFFGISVDQLIGITPLTNNNQYSGYHESKDNWARIPLRQWDGINSHLKSPHEPCATYIQTDIDISENSYALTINCNSWDGFAINSILVIDPKKSPSNESYIIGYNKSSKTYSLYKLILLGHCKYIQPPVKGIAPSMMTDDFEFKGLVVQTRLDF